LKAVPVPSLKGKEHGNAAILDRFLSHLELVTMRGKSYRLHKNGSAFAKGNPE